LQPAILSAIAFTELLAHPLISEIVVGEVIVQASGYREIAPIALGTTKGYWCGFSLVYTDVGAIAGDYHDSRIFSRFAARLLAGHFGIGHAALAHHTG
jgi:hypothetical protein